MFVHAPTGADIWVSFVQWNGVWTQWMTPPCQGWLLMGGGVDPRGSTGSSRGLGY